MNKNMESKTDTGKSTEQATHLADDAICELSITTWSAIKTWEDNRTIAREMRRIGSGYSQDELLALAQISRIQHICGGRRQLARQSGMSETRLDHFERSLVFAKLIEVKDVRFPCVRRLVLTQKGLALLEEVQDAILDAYVELSDVNVHKMNLAE